MCERGWLYCKEFDLGSVGGGVWTFSYAILKKTRLTHDKGLWGGFFFLSLFFFCGGGDHGEGETLRTILIGRPVTEEFRKSCLTPYFRLFSDGDILFLPSAYRFSQPLLRPSIVMLRETANATMAPPSYVSQLLTLCGLCRSNRPSPLIPSVSHHYHDVFISQGSSLLLIGICQPSKRGWKALSYLLRRGFSRTQSVGNTDMRYICFYAHDLC